MSFSESKAHMAIALLAVFTPVYRSFAAAGVPLLLLETWLVIGLMLLIAAVLALILHKTGPKIRLLVLTLILFVSLDLAGAYVSLFEALQLDYRLAETARVLTKGLILLLIPTAIYALLRLIRRHAVRVVTLYFAVVGLAVIVTEPLPTLASGTAGTDSPAAAANDAGDPRKPPLVIHLLFDGMLAPGAIEPGIEKGKAVYEAMRRLAESHGFRVFERAFSRHVFTVPAIPNMMNAEYRGEKEGLRLERGRTELRGNAYFDDYAARGYAVRVYQQNDYLNYCANKNVAACNSYSSAWSIVNSVRQGDASGAFSTLPERTLGLLSVLLCAHNYNYTGCRLARVIRESPAGRALIREETFKAMSLIQFEQTGFSGWFDNFVEDVMRSERGTLFFAHFLVPHDPFLLADDCGLRWRWERYDRFAGTDPAAPATMTEKRKVKLESYYDQVQCALLKVRELLERIDESERHRDALILVHGDHGSRIPSRSDSIDFAANYGIFFAVRAPEYSRAGHDCELAALPDLFARYVRHRDGKAVATPANKTIYTRAGWASDAPHVEREMPEFSCFHREPGRL